MTSQRFVKLCLNAVSNLRALAPKDTGNLAYNAIRYEMPSPDTFVIYVDEAIAPYMPYTNEEWISPKWNGKKNPNENWFDRAAELIAKNIAGETKGVMK